MPNVNGSLPPGNLYTLEPAGQGVRPVPPPRPSRESNIVNVRIPGLLSGLNNNSQDNPTQRVLLVEDSGKKYQSIAVAWNQKHIFLRLPNGELLRVPNYGKTTDNPSTLTDGMIQLTLPEPGDYLVRDPSHAMAAERTLAQFCVNTPHRLMGYRVNEELISSVFPNRCLYYLGDGKCMYCKDGPGQALAPYAVMLLLEGRGKEDVVKTAGPLIEIAEKRVSDHQSLINYLGCMSESLKPVNINLRGKTHGEVLQLIIGQVEKYKRAVLFVTGNRGVLIDKAWIDQQGNIMLTIRDAYTGAWRVIRDHEDLWVPLELLRKAFDQPGSLAQQERERNKNTDQSPHSARQGAAREEGGEPFGRPDIRQHGIGDYLVYLEPRAAPPTPQKPQGGLRA